MLGIVCATIMRLLKAVEHNTRLQMLSSAGHRCPFWKSWHVVAGSGAWGAPTDCLSFPGCSTCSVISLAVHLVNLSSDALAAVRVLCTGVQATVSRMQARSSEHTCAIKPRAYSMLAFRARASVHPREPPHEGSSRQPNMAPHADVSRPRHMLVAQHQASCSRASLSKFLRLPQAECRHLCCFAPLARGGSALACPRTRRRRTSAPAAT